MSFLPPFSDNPVPKLLARFRVNHTDVLAVFKAISKEDFQDVVGLLPQGTPLPASDKMTYLLARLEVRKGIDCSPYIAISDWHDLTAMLCSPRVAPEPATSTPTSSVWSPGRPR